MVDARWDAAECRGQVLGGQGLPDGASRGNAGGGLCIEMLIVTDTRLVGDSTV